MNLFLSKCSIGVAKIFDWGEGANHKSHRWRPKKKVFTVRFWIFDCGGPKFSWRRIQDWGEPKLQPLSEDQNNKTTKKDLHIPKGRFCPENQVKTKKKVLTDWSQVGIKTTNATEGRLVSFATDLSWLALQLEGFRAPCALPPGYAYEMQFSYSKWCYHRFCSFFYAGKLLYAFVKVVTETD